MEHHYSTTLAKCRVPCSRRTVLCVSCGSHGHFPGNCVLSNAPMQDHYSDAPTCQPDMASDGSSHCPAQLSYYVLEVPPAPRLLALTLESHLLTLVGTSAEQLSVPFSPLIRLPRKITLGICPHMEHHLQYNAKCCHPPVDRRWPRALPPHPFVLLIL